MSTLLFCIAIIIIGYNLIINISNLSKVVSFCFESNSTTHYWSLFKEGCLSRRAIYSSLIAMVIGVLVFIVILPIIAIRGLFEKNQMEENYLSGAHFRYTDTNLSETKFCFSNLEELGVDKFEPKATGRVNLDLMLAMGYIEKAFINKGLKAEINPFEVYDLKNNIRVLIPATVEAEEKSYPLYLIYNEEHKAAYQKINPVLKENHFQNALYLSVIPV